MSRSAERQLQGEMSEDAVDEIEVLRQHEEKDSGDQSGKEMKTKVGGGKEMKTMKTSLATAVSSASIIYTLLFCLVGL